MLIGRTGDTIFIGDTKNLGLGVTALSDIEYKEKLAPIRAGEASITSLFNDKSQYASFTDEELAAGTWFAQEGRIDPEQIPDRGDVVAATGEYLLHTANVASP